MGDTIADQMLDDTLRVLCGGVDSDKASRIVADALDALGKQVLALQATPLTQEPYKTKCPACHKSVEVLIPPKPETLARAISLTARMIDDTARLIHFTEGRPDSRQGASSADWLKSLTNEQFAQVMLWVEENVRVRGAGTAE